MAEKNEKNITGDKLFTFIKMFWNGNNPKTIEEEEDGIKKDYLEFDEGEGKFIFNEDQYTFPGKKTGKVKTPFIPVKFDDIVAGSEIKKIYQKNTVDGEEDFINQTFPLPDEENLTNTFWWKINALDFSETLKVTFGGLSKPWQNHVQIEDLKKQLAETDGKIAAAKEKKEKEEAARKKAAAEKKKKLEETIAKNRKKKPESREDKERKEIEQKVLKFNQKNKDHAFQIPINYEHGKEWNEDDITYKIGQYLVLSEKSNKIIVEESSPNNDKKNIKETCEEYFKYIDDDYYENINTYTWILKKVEYTKKWETIRKMELGVNKKVPTEQDRINYLNKMKNIDDNIKKSLLENIKDSHWNMFLHSSGKIVTYNDHKKTPYNLFNYIMSTMNTVRLTENKQILTDKEMDFGEPKDWWILTFKKSPGMVDKNKDHGEGHYEFKLNLKF